MSESIALHECYRKSDKYPGQAYCCYEKCGEGLFLCFICDDNFYSEEIEVAYCPFCGSKGERNWERDEESV